MVETYFPLIPYQPIRLRKTWDALLIRDSTSASTVLSLFKILPRYLNCVTCSMFISSRIASVVLRLGIEFFGRMVMYFVLLKFILSPKHTHTRTNKHLQKYPVTPTTDDLRYLESQSEHHQQAKEDPQCYQ